MIVTALESMLRMGARLRGIDRYRDPLSYFDAGGLAEAEARCAEANRDLLAFVRPDGVPPAGNVVHLPAPRRDRGTVVERLYFDSPLAPRDRPTDRVEVLLARRAEAPAQGRAVLFHHPVYQSEWDKWLWFLDALIRRVPVAMMAAPNHFSRTPAGEFPGESTINPNPYRLFRAIRQWGSDQRAVRTVLAERLGLEVTGVVGYSFGAFQTLMLAAAGDVDLPIVTMACTNRYAYGLTRGVLGDGILEGMRRVGIDESKLWVMTDSLQLERHVPRLRGRPTLYVRGEFDPVDPSPSLERLEEALGPMRSLVLPTGHATLFLYRNRILHDTVAFLEETGGV